MELQRMTDESPKKPQITEQGNDRKVQNIFGNKASIQVRNDVPSPCFPNNETLKKYTNVTPWFRNNGQTYRDIDNNIPSLKPFNELSNKRDMSRHVY